MVSDTRYHIPNFYKQKASFFTKNLGFFDKRDLFYRKIQNFRLPRTFIEHSVFFKKRGHPIDFPRKIDMKFFKYVKKAID